MIDRIGASVRVVCASLVLGVVLSLAVACGSQEEVSPSPTPQAVGATPSPAHTVTEVPTALVSTATPVATSTPPPTLVQQPRWEIRQYLSQGKQYVVLEDGLSPEAYVIAAAEPELVVGEQWEIVFTVDTDGNDRQEAIVFHYTGGAHCCSEYLILDSGSEGIRLQDRFSLGNAGIVEVKDLNGDGLPELVGSDDRLAYFADLSYVVSPFLPLVLCRSAQGPYYDCTPDFPQFLMDNADTYEGFLLEAVEGEYSEEEVRSAALGLYFSYLRLGMAEEGEGKVKSICPECWQWLSENGSEIDARLESEQPWRE